MWWCIGQHNRARCTDKLTLDVAYDGNDGHTAARQWGTRGHKSVMETGMKKTNGGHRYGEVKTNGGDECAFWVVSERRI